MLGTFYLISLGVALRGQSESVHTCKTIFHFFTFSFDAERLALPFRQRLDPASLRGDLPVNGLGHGGRNRLLHA